MISSTQQFKQQINEKNQQNVQQSQAQIHNDVIIQHRVSPILLRIHADNQDKKLNALFWGAFIAFIILLGLATLLLPSATLVRTLSQELSGTYLQQCKHPVKWDNQKRVRCGNFDPQNGNLSVGYLLNDIKNLNQFAIFYINFHTKNSSIGLNISQPIQTFFAELSKTSVDGNSDTSYFFQLHGNIYFDSSDFTLDSAMMDNQTLGVYTKAVEIERTVNWNYYILIITFSNPEQLKNVQSISWDVLTANPQFTVFTIVIRYIFLSISIASLVFYIIRFIKIPQGQRVVEQKLILVLGILLILFNDPWYPITVLAPNPFSNFLSVFLIVNFVIILMLFWILMFDRIHMQNGQRNTEVVRWYKIGYVIVLYIFTLILYLNYAYNHLQSSPILPTDQLTSGKFLALQIITIIIAAIGFLYIGVRYFQICFRFNEKLHRNQLFCYFSIFFLLIMLVFFIIGGMRTFDYAQNRVLFFYAGMNIYIFYLLRMYTVTTEEFQQIESGFRLSEREHIIGMQSPNQQGVYLDLDHPMYYHGGQSGRIGNDAQNHQEIQNRNRQASNKNKQNGQNISYLRQQKQEDKVKGDTHLPKQQSQPKIDFFNKREQNSSENSPKGKRISGLDNIDKNQQLQEQDPYQSHQKEANKNIFQTFQIQ